MHLPLALQIPTIQQPHSDAHAVSPTYCYNTHLLSQHHAHAVSFTDSYNTTSIFRRTRLWPYRFLQHPLSDAHAVSRTDSYNTTSTFWVVQAHSVQAALWVIQSPGRRLAEPSKTPCTVSREAHWNTTRAVRFDVQLSSPYDTARSVRHNDTAARNTVCSVSCTAPINTIRSVNRTAAINTIRSVNPTAPINRIRSPMNTINSVHCELYSSPQKYLASPVQVAHPAAKSTLRLLELKTRCESQSFS